MQKKEIDITQQLTDMRIELSNQLCLEALLKTFIYRVVIFSKL